MIRPALLGGALAVLLLAVLLFRRPLSALLGLLARSGVGMIFLWLFQGVSGPLGVQLGVNLLNGLVLGLLGAPGFALLLMAQWAVR